MVEDERTINDALAQRLRAEGYVVEQAFDGPSAVELAAAVRPDVVLLDVMLPGLRRARGVPPRSRPTRPVPVLMLTARDDEADVLVGLGVGADDYLTKPFSMREVVARVAALLRRVERAAALADERPAALEVGRRAASTPAPGVRPSPARPCTSPRPSSTCCCAWPGSPVRSSAASGCCATSGTGATPGRAPARPAPSTATSRRCAARWARRGSAPCTASATPSRTCA